MIKSAALSPPLKNSAIGLDYHSRACGRLSDNGGLCPTGCQNLEDPKYKRPFAKYVFDGFFGYGNLAPLWYFQKRPANYSGQRHYDMPFLHHSFFQNQGIKGKEAGRLTTCSLTQLIEYYPRRLPSGSIFSNYL